MSSRLQVCSLQLRSRETAKSIYIVSTRKFRTCIQPFHKYWCLSCMWRSWIQHLAQSSHKLSSHTTGNMHERPWKEWLLFKKLDVSKICKTQTKRAEDDCSSWGCALTLQSAAQLICYHDQPCLHIQLKWAEWIENWSVHICQSTATNAEIYWWHRLFRKHHPASVYLPKFPSDNTEPWWALQFKEDSRLASRQGIEDQLLWPEIHFQAAQTSNE